MVFLIRYKNVWRLLLLLLLFVALSGPWTLDLINVPAEYPCSAPFIRLEGDFCGLPLSGWRVIFWIAGGTFDVIVGQITGAAAINYFGSVLWVDLLYSLVLFLFVLPFFATLFITLRGYRRGRQIFLMASWGLALGAAILMGIAGYPRLFWVVWGVWLYIGLAASALILEGVVMVGGRKAQP